MSFSFSSLIVTIIWSTLLILTLNFLLTNETISKKIRADVLDLFSVVIVLRLFLPFEFIITHTVVSTKVLPVIYKFNDTTKLYGQILAIAWIVGFGMKMVKLFFSFKRTKRLIALSNKIKKSSLDQNVQKIIPARTNLYCLPEIRYPCTIGSFKTKIIIPTLEFSKKDFNFIIQHEIYHINNYDNLKKMFVEVLACIYWWFPPVYLYRKQVSLINELKVDAQMTKNVSPSEYISYMTCLAETYKKFKNRKIERGNLLTSNFVIREQNRLKNRLKFLSYTESSQKISQNLKLLLLITFVVSLLFVFEPSYHDESKIKGTFKLEDGQNYILEINKKYYLYSNGKNQGEIKNYKNVSETKKLPIVKIKK